MNIRSNLFMEKAFKIQALQQNPELDRFLSYIWNNQKQEIPEIWREIKETNGLYYVSNYGRVLSVNKNSKHILHQIPKKDTLYLEITTSIDGEGTNRQVHKLVAEHFLYKPEGINEDDLLVHHIDGNKWNNNADNLIYLTSKQHGKAHTILNKKKE